jgi:hypothetical protein
VAIRYFGERDEVPPRPVKLRAAENVGPLGLAQLWADLRLGLSTTAPSMPNYPNSHAASRERATPEPALALATMSKSGGNSPIFNGILWSA